MEKKKNVAVLFGGCSPEYSVSLESAGAVIAHMDPARYTPIPVGIDRDGEWSLFTGTVEEICSDTWHAGEHCIPAAVSPSRKRHELLLLRPEGIERLPIDVAFPVLHGRNGEDGTVQGVFELAGIPLAGCGVLPSALCMDKDRSHRLAAAAGVAVPRGRTFAPGEEEAALAWAEELGGDVFVKPVRAGSSYGITRVRGREGLQEAFRRALEYDDQVILEETIAGFEVGCAVLGDGPLTIGEPDEIELQGDFFDFTEKYTLKTSQIHVPARISAGMAARVKEEAGTVYRALGCRGFARVDFFLEPGGRLVFNEVNTIPGFTAHSRYPSMMAAAGMSFEAVISAAIEQAVAR